MGAADRRGDVILRHGRVDRARRYGRVRARGLGVGGRGVSEESGDGGLHRRRLPDFETLRQRSGRSLSLRGRLLGHYVGSSRSR
jgi:hypothetical protein